MTFEDNQKYELHINRWYGGRGRCKAIRVEIDGGCYNMALHPQYVKILSNQAASVWGSWINMTIKRCKESNALFQKRKGK